MEEVVTQQIREFAQTVALNKGRAYFVGGVVRDGLLGMETRDIDIEVHGLAPERVRSITANHFKDVDDIGLAFGILQARYKGEVIDVSLPRTDSKVAAGHTGFDIKVDPELGLATASRRRDFTINAMLQDVLTGEVVDLVGGKEDLDARVLRMVDPETFGDDPLRVLRAVQLVARFELEVDPATLERMMHMCDALHEISDDRKREEWRKVFTRGKRPSLGLELARQVGAFGEAQLLVEDMKATMQDAGWHPEGDVWVHTLWGTDEVAKIAEDEALSERERLIVQLGILCHDVAKPEKTYEQDGHIRSTGHAVAGVKHVKTLLGAMGLGAHAKLVEPLVEYHHAPIILKARQVKGEYQQGQLTHVARAAKPTTMRWLGLVTLADLRSRGPYPPDLDRGAYIPESAYWFMDEARSLGILEQSPPDVVRGNELIGLGLSPGPAFGYIVRVANELHDEHGWSREQILLEIKNMPGIAGMHDMETIRAALLPRPELPVSDAS